MKVYSSNIYKNKIGLDVYVERILMGINEFNELEWF
jgi:hypothetical protein